MANSNTDHSANLRQETAEIRRKRILAEGGKQLHVILESPYASKLEELREYYARGNKLTYTELFQRLIVDAYAHRKVE